MQLCSQQETSKLFILKLVLVKFFCFYSYKRCTKCCTVGVMSLEYVYCIHIYMSVFEGINFRHTMVHYVSCDRVGYSGIHLNTQVGVFNHYSHTLLSLFCVLLLCSVLYGNRSHHIDLDHKA